MRLPRRDKLISAVYSATLSPDGYDETLDVIDELVFGARLHEDQKAAPSERVGLHGVGERVELEVDPELLDHFGRAHDIQKRVGRPKYQQHKALVLLETAPNPTFIFDQSEKIIARNIPARDSGQADSQSLEEVCGDADVLENIRNYVAGRGENGKLAVPGHQRSARGSNTCILVEKLDADMSESLLEGEEGAETHYFLTVVDLGFGPEITELFQKTYGLTGAEADISLHLARGLQVIEIAEERGATVQTLRTQLKSIKRKTNTRDIPAIVRLLCGFSAGVLVSSQISAKRSSTSPNFEVMKSTKQIRLRDGRRMSYMEQGNPNGIPVLMVHNMPYGVELPEAAIQAASRLNLRIIAPYRPGYGDSDRVKHATSKSILNAVASDFCELLDKLGIPQATVLGQTIGAVYALRFARLYPNRVTHLFAVGRAPIWKDEWSAQTPKRQRLALRLAKHLPQLLQIIMWATVKFLDKGNGEEFIITSCKDGTSDAHALKNHETLRLMVEGADDGFKQGVDAFCLDCFLAVEDFTDEARELMHAFHILHGDDDQIVKISQSQAFVKSVPGTELEVIKGAGQLLMYSHWDRVLKAIKTKHRY
ncbi:alpha/beta hydrolase [Pseudovibrio sp. Tun.PSC04-5.I4]|uniref:alpha/beta hydrolase n=1 Tax=Pseudovibrio sp. Tun.PSC04-5.I4 TaxID=1798213 RepID=UPI0008870492|nr:alpha/beta hydrolase [Pseudovibrio sp. Tun.PSC04-5.I4]SDR47221.1 Pimeloyl-ACP methyl ester carboxylesterase [Pseudovibrio sp. Tun.PSC04-5.I4]